MNYVKMDKTSGFWWPEESAGTGMDAIGAFLSSDVGSHGANDFRSWLLDTECTEMSGNHSLLIRRGDHMLINSQFAEDFYADASDFSTNALIGLLEQWQAICNKRDPKLIGMYISYDGTQFQVAPEFDTIFKKIKRCIVGAYKKISKPVMCLLAHYNLVKNPYALPFKIEDISFQGEVELCGFHFDPNGELEKQKLVTLENKLICSSTGMTRATLVRLGQLTATTHVSMFPSTWSKEVFTETLAESLQNAVTDTITIGDFLVQQGMAKNGLVFEFIIDAQYGELIAAYPILQRQQGVK